MEIATANAFCAQLPKFPWFNVPDKGTNWIDGVILVTRNEFLIVPEGWFGAFLFSTQS